jgi:hypothetical protein
VLLNDVDIRLASMDSGVAGKSQIMEFSLGKSKKLNVCTVFQKVNFACFLKEQIGKEELQEPIF